MQRSLEKVNLSRLIYINSNKSKKSYAKSNVFFTSTPKAMSTKAIDLYNQGCPKTWNIDPEILKRNEFKIFSTGDAFSILSAAVKISKNSVNIHVGLEHATYSPLVLLHEALQLCRCAYEHSAGMITIALPEQFHPVLHLNDFNLLLKSLFTASGANKIYYYDKNYTGNLDEINSKVMSLTMSEQSDLEKYQISKNDLLDYLHLPENSQTSLDDQVMHFIRKTNLGNFLSKCDLDRTNIVEDLCISNNAPSEINISKTSNQPHVLLCCSANKPLAEKIAESLIKNGEMVKVYSIAGRGEQASIPKEAEICGAVVTIVQSTRPNPDNINEVKEYEKNGASSYFFEAIMIARQAHLRGADKINLINPYQFSARSDKAENNPKGKTGAYVQHDGMLFKAARVNNVISAECHDAHTMSGSYTGENIRGSALHALTSMATKIARDWIENPDRPTHGQFRLVTPDAGATKRTNELKLQLQDILGKEFCESRISGDKQRDSHQDDSALINSLNSGSVGINDYDKYLITDDETATGSTLCQAIKNLADHGAKDISVAVVHNNMPLDWLSRQMCLARFFYLGVNDLHFSDTQEMGTLATSYDNLIQTCVQKYLIASDEAENQISAWFKKNIGENFSDKTDEHLYQEFNRFKSMFSQLQSKITIHSLANEFARQVREKLNTEKTAEVSCDNVNPQGYVADKGGLLFFPNKQNNKPDFTEGHSYNQGMQQVRKI